MPVLASVLLLGQRQSLTQDPVGFCTRSTKNKTEVFCSLENTVAMDFILIAAARRGLTRPTLTAGRISAAGILNGFESGVAATLCRRITNSIRAGNLRVCRRQSLWKSIPEIFRARRAISQSSRNSPV